MLRVWTQCFVETVKDICMKMSQGMLSGGLAPCLKCWQGPKLKVFLTDWSGLLFAFDLHPSYKMVNLSLYAIKAVVLLDAEGNRVLSKYYGKDYASTKDQKAFEKGLFDKTKRAQGRTPF